MKSEWKIRSQYLGGKKIFQVYRLKDMDEDDQIGNRTYAGAWKRDKAEAVELMEKLNKEEAEKEKAPGAVATAPSAEK
ncbi:hypothetical protein [uncultured Selenomonas sp.]|uniref:hypothetical protein n=1 Tax=uncultured Selenomonas sp. TaxID=159275 RepID=UPI002675B665|nr:hypothetical protein [uncultured Selenomonas sp.]